MPAATSARARRAAAVARRLLRCDPIAYAIAWIGWVGFWCFPVVSGLLLLVVLDKVSAHSRGSSVWIVLAVLAGVELARWIDLWLTAVQWHGAWVGWHSIPRLNILRGLAVDAGPTADRLPGSPGEAVSRFRDDCQDLAMVLDVWLDVSGAVIASTIAFAIMAAIDWQATLIVAVPIVAVVLVCNWLGRAKLREWRRSAPREHGRGHRVHRRHVRRHHRGEGRRGRAVGAGPLRRVGRDQVPPPPAATRWARSSC